jgi:hypothetical protein
MQLEGSTQQYPLSELIALLSENSITGVLEIGAPDAIGRIFCRAGQVYHAEASNAFGFDAFRRLIQADDAPFHIILGAHHRDDTLWPDTLSLIAHVRRQELLYRRMRRHIPALDWVPVLRAANGDAEVRLNATLWPALALIDGQRSVAAIAAELGHEPFEVGMLLGQLVARGLAAIEPPQPAAQLRPEQSACDAAPGLTEPNCEATASATRPASSGFFEQLLTGREDQPAGKHLRRRMWLQSLIFS